MLWDLILIKLEDCSSTDDYVTKKLQLAKKLNGTGLKVPDKWLALLLLAGLPKRYEPMVMALENLHKTLKSDEVAAQIQNLVTHKRENGDDPAGYFTQSSLGYKRGRSSYRGNRGNRRGNWRARGNRGKQNFAAGSGQQISNENARC